MTDIEQLTKAHPLPNGVPDAVLNRSELAEFFGTSANTITEWIKAGMPVLRQGTNGTAYEFQASHCWAWKQNRDAALAADRQAAQETIAAMRLALTGGESGDSIQALPPKERREIIDLETAQERWKRERNMLLPREDVLELLESVLRLFRDGISNLPDYLEKRAGLTPDQTDSLIGASEDFLGEMERVITRYFETRPVDTTPERTSLFN